MGIVGLPGAVVVLLLLEGAAPNRVRQRQAAPPAPEAKVEQDPAIDARVHFERGLKFFAQQKWDLALAEFLRSRELKPLASNTLNAALCLKELGRIGEAFEMFEVLLREFPALDERAMVERSLKQLRTQVGEIVLLDAPPNASVLIDGRVQGQTPLEGPLRVSAGTHLVRVHLQGAQPFQVDVSVAGGQRREIPVQMVFLTASGRLRVRESTERPARVRVDGVVVGQTPWEGDLSVGQHVLSLEGEGDFGTPPMTFALASGQVVVLNLTTEALACRLQVAPSPFSAAVAIDSVEVGRGGWEGRLRCGAHRVEVGEDGFIPAVRSLKFDESQFAHLSIALERDPTSALWGRPGHVYLEVSAAAMGGLVLGGTPSEVCTGACRETLPLGFGGLLRLGYQMPSRLGFALEVGWLQLSSRLTQRAALLSTVPDGAGLEGTLSERRVLNGFQFGVSAALFRGRQWPWMVGLGSGVLLGTFADERASVVQRGDEVVEVSPAQWVGPARSLYVAPEFRLSWQKSEQFEVGVSLRPMLLVGLGELRWEVEQDQVAPGLGFVGFGREVLAQRLLWALVAGLTVRTSFL